MNKQLEEVHNTLFKLATTGDDGFRQWYYPQLPLFYNVNPLVASLAKKYILGDEYTVDKAIELIIKRANNDYFRNNR